MALYGLEVTGLQTAMLALLADTTAVAGVTPSFWGAVILGIGLVAQAVQGIWKMIRDQESARTAREEALAARIKELEEQVKADYEKLLEKTEQLLNGAITRERELVTGVIELKRTPEALTAGFVVVREEINASEDRMKDFVRDLLGSRERVDAGNGRVRKP
jgi:phosphate uptake regulator